MMSGAVFLFPFVFRFRGERPVELLLQNPVGRRSRLEWFRFEVIIPSGGMC